VLITGCSNRIIAETAAAIVIKALSYKLFGKADLAKTTRRVLGGKQKNENLRIFIND
jgi:hypothetical protein